ncbi:MULTISPECIES: helix-hairpin-helix domain-containing protein [Kitasatospora]|uniref:Uncharacterized protein n=1 Tax=Kitasatospora setae (strain ATCC 33774 / DSM 43861 / JCM 3304 / KCC A-0304 / NBRC 14216 / KM-6054) TaxID=452652 RepID=E4N0Z4_KITSK|nr:MULTISPECIES: helix-hairpin-helix domain-containing protein [Kitasatospora]BAJ31828.1 hypothetical protein KSE_60620 [Kitasatospora setae KM-6054]
MTAPPPPRSAGNATPPLPPPPPARRPTGKWYFVAMICSFGLLTPVPFLHAAARLNRRALRIRAAVYAVLVVLLFTLNSFVPKDAQGHVTGKVGNALEGLWVLALIGLVTSACLQIAPVRREVFGLAAPPVPPPTGPGAADPAVAARLAARARREEARALAARDAVVAHELRIGRPDLTGPYDDGGLVDLNSAPAEVISAHCSLSPETAARVVRAREELGQFRTVDEVAVYAELAEGETARVKEYAVFLPK